jgi:hypothetical protein
MQMGPAGFIIACAAGMIWQEMGITCAGAYGAEHASRLPPFLTHSRHLHGSMNRPAHIPRFSSRAITCSSAYFPLLYLGQSSAHPCRTIHLPRSSPDAEHRATTRWY